MTQHEPNTSIRVLTADDHPLIRDGLAAVLRGRPDFEVVGSAANGEEAIEAYVRLHPDIVLMDLRMPVMDGPAATRAILAEHTPRIALTAREIEVLRLVADGLSNAQVADCIVTTALGRGFIRLD